MNDIHYLLTKPESEVLEFKKAENNFDLDDLGKYFSALSNEANLRKVDYAYLVFGYDDNKKQIVGTSFKNSHKSLQSLKQNISQHTTDNHTFFEIQECFINNKRLLVFQILPAPKGIPIAWKAIRYARNDDSLTVLSDAKIDKIKNQTLKYDWSALILEDANIDDLDEHAILKARELYAEKYPKRIKELKEWDNITFLNKAKVLKKGKVTNAAIILLGKEESECLINPAVAKIRWILKDSKGFERDYVIKSCPLLLAVDDVFNKIRNLKYRYINPYFKTLFPEELDTYDPYIIREAINNAIAHQDYELGGRINVVEFDDKLVFSNLGNFIPEDINTVLNDDAPQEVYRNSFLVQAMVELNMVDTIGSGIRRMFKSQLDRLFPMPDYNLEKNRVELIIYGKILNLDYSMLLSKHSELSLSEIEMLNRVLFNKELKDSEISHLRSKKLIEGRKPNLYLSSTVANLVDKKIEYTKNKGLDDDYYKNLIVKSIEQHKKMSKKDIEKLLIDKLPDILDGQQKHNKIKNLIASLRKSNLIFISGKFWMKIK